MSAEKERVALAFLKISQFSLDLAEKNSLAAIAEQDSITKAKFLGAAEAYLDIGKRVNDAVRDAIAAKR